MNLKKKSENSQEILDFKSTTAIHARKNIPYMFIAFSYNFSMDDFFSDVGSPYV